MNKDQLSLSELNARIKEHLRSGFPGTFWVVAEISEIHQNSSGHCYLELIEKDQVTDRLIARMRANIWAYTFRMLKPYFENATGYELNSGLKVMLKVTVEFHEVYSISLNVKDIDPNYTLGDLARKKQEIINRLMKEGVFDMNRELSFPLVPQRLAVISSKTAAGLGDFVNTLEMNSKGFRFDINLFPAIMQGDQAAASIIDAFECIAENPENFDLVVLIRGGGSQADLECFNSYELAYFITQFPLPVVTGIGHERDVSIADLVANEHLKTPTAVAAFLIDKLDAFFSLILSYEQAVHKCTLQTLQEEKARLKSFGKILSLMARSSIAEKNTSLKNLVSQSRILSLRFLSSHSENLTQEKKMIKLISRNLLLSFTKETALYSRNLTENLNRFIKKENEALNAYQKNNDLLDPRRIMKRGFSISKSGGTIIKDSSRLKEGDLIETLYYSGSTESKVTKIKKHE